MATLNEDLEALPGPRGFGYAQSRQDWVKITSEIAQGRLVWGASIRHVVTSIRDVRTDERCYKYTHR